MSNLTAQQAIKNFTSYVGKPRSAYPWLAHRPNLYDCAAAVSYITGLAHAGHDMVWVHEIKDRMVKNKTWTTKGIPKPGDIIVFDWSGKKTGADHTGMVISADAHHIKYVSADSTPKPPRPVTINPAIGYGAVTGWGRVVEYAKPIIPAKPAGAVAPTTSTAKPIA
jgi:CHAP domain